MSETSNRTAWLKDIDKDTFARFCRFAYTGDYAEPAPDIILDEHTIGEEPVGKVPYPPEPEAEPDLEPTPEPVPESDNRLSPEPSSSGNLYGQNTNGSPSTKRIGKKKKGKNSKRKSASLSQPTEIMDEVEAPKTELWESFADKQYNYTASLPPSPSRGNAEVCEEYTPVFLCHASLYVFGDKYDIEPLRELALSKLHDCLCKFTIYRERVGDVVELVRYAYSNTAGIHDEPLRSLVVQYIAASVERLTGVPEFDEYLEESGAHSKDLVCLIVQRLRD